MKITIDNISKVLNIPYFKIMELMELSGIKFEENHLISEIEMKKLRPILIRYYQQHNTDDMDETSNNASNCDLKEDIKESELVENFLEQLIQNHIIMMDTCSIMHDKCDVLVDAMLPLLKKYNKKIIIPNKVIEELRKHILDSENSMKSVLAQKGLELCKRLEHQNCLTVRGSKNDNFADNVFFVHFLDWRFKYHMLLITQDYKLSCDILKLNNMKTGGGNPVKVFKISADGSLIETTE